MTCVPRAYRQLELVGDLVSAVEAAGARIWLRGGWAMDFFVGRVTRDHADIDLFARAADPPVLAAILRDLSRSVEAYGRRVACPGLRGVDLDGSG